MATLSAISWSPCLSSRRASTTSASLTFLTGIGTRNTSVSVNCAAPRSSLLHCSFITSSSALSVSSPSSFSGLSLGLDLNSNVGVIKRRASSLVVRAGKAALCLTKRSRSRKSLARTHGFRKRMRTTSGRAMIKRRRAKGRKVLCTKSNPSSGKRA